MKNKKEKTKKILIGILLFIALIPNVLGTIDIKITLPQETFYPTDNLFFDYSITTDTSTEISYVSNIYCDALLSPLNIEKTTNLDPQVAFAQRFEYGLIYELNETVSPQECFAHVRITSPIEISQNESFQIMQVQKASSLLVTPKSCKDPDCRETSTTFIEGEQMFFDYTANFQDITINALLIFPNETTQTISLPYSFTPQTIGTYTLESIERVEEPFYEEKWSYQFGVIEKMPEFETKFEPETIDEPTVPIDLPPDDSVIADEKKGFEEKPFFLTELINKLTEWLGNNLLVSFIIGIVLILLFVTVVYGKKHLES